jgi:hypothetical protein
MRLPPLQKTLERKMPTKTGAKKSSKKPVTPKKKAVSPKPFAVGAGTGSLKVTDTTVKICRPFTLEVMVFAPASGFKIEVLVEKSCTPQADAIWKIVFDLYKKKTAGEGFDQLVHVSFTGGTPVQMRGIETTAANGINDKQADTIVNEIGPAVLSLKDSAKMTPKELEETKRQVKTASGKVAEFAL